MKIEENPLSNPDSNRWTSETRVPIWVLTDRNISVLEAIVCYLKEIKHLKFSEIGVLLGRDQRTIWTVYNRAEHKQRGTPNLSSGETIPLEVMADRSSSIFESVVGYLFEKKGFRYSEIAKLTARNQRTIWTVYSRYKKKRGGES